MLRRQKTSKSSLSRRILRFPEQGVMLRRPKEENLRENGKILGIWRRKNFYLENFPIFAVLIYPPGRVICGRSLNYPVYFMEQ